MNLIRTMLTTTGVRKHCTEMEVKNAMQLKWLNYKQHQQIVRRRCQVSAMAYPRHGPASSTRNHLHFPDELDYPEDPALGYVQDSKQEIRRPPGIHSLEQWGRQILADGKHAGKTFAEAFTKDPGYVDYMVAKTNLTSPWALSFQNYARANLPEDSVKMSKGKTKPKVNSKAKTKMPKEIRSEAEENSDFIVVPGQSSLKRGMTSLETEEEKMDLTDAEKTSQLEAQMAVLQRELDKVRPK